MLLLYNYTTFVRMHALTFQLLIQGLMSYKIAITNFTHILIVATD